MPGASMKELEVGKGEEVGGVMEGALGVVEGTEEAGSRAEAGQLCLSGSSTRMETIRFLHRWKVQQFSVQLELSEVGVELKSSAFGSEDGRYRFLLKLFPAGRDEECRGYLSLYLQILQCPQQRLRFRVNFYIDTTEGPKSCTLNKNVVTINKGGTVTASKFFGTDSLRSRSQRYTPDDTLTVGVELTVFGSSDNFGSGEEEAAAPAPSSLAADLRRALRDGLHADCVLHAGGRSFRAHKGVLAARSDVFAAMFRHSGMEEAEKSEARLQDVSAEAVEGLLQWIYADDTAALESRAEELLAAADEYGLGGLKAEAETRLAKGVSLSNVVGRLHLADLHSSPGLRRACTALVRRKRSEVLGSADWARLLRDAPALAASVLQEILLPDAALSGPSQGSSQAPSPAQPSPTRPSSPPSKRHRPS